MALGKGLASLIPNRRVEDPDDVLDRIDDMDEYVEALEEPEAAEDGTTVDVVAVDDEDDSEIDIPVEDEEVLSEESDIEEPEIELEPGVDDSKPEEVDVEPKVEEMKAEKKTAAAAVHISRGTVTKLSAQDSPQVSISSDMRKSDDEIWDKHERDVVHIPLQSIRINPMQPRRMFDPEDLEELKASIQQHGILQPIVVRRLADDKYELIAGERRLRATTDLKWDKIPAVVRMDVTGERTSLEFALVENIQRQNLNPIEEAEAYRQLNEDFGMTHEEIGQRVGKSRVAVTNMVRFLQLPAEVRQGLVEGKITAGHARAILMIPDEDKQVRFYQHMIAEGLTVRRAEVRARNIQRKMKLTDPLRNRRRKRPEVALKYTPILEERYGFDAHINFNESRNRFEVAFWAHNQNDLDELMAKLVGGEKVGLDTEESDDDEE